jgi:hypothetical protein
MRGWTLSVEGAAEKHRALQVNATPANGAYEEVIAASPMRERRATLTLDQPTRLGPGGFETQLHIEAMLISFREREADPRMMSRFFYRGSFERPIGKGRFVARSLAAWVAGGESLPAQHLVYVGGPTTAPGYDFHQFAGRAAASQRMEAQLPIPFVSIPLGRYGRTPAALTLAPFVNAAWVDRTTFARRPGESLELLATERNGWHPSVGLGIVTLFDLLRMDVARGTRDGRWTFTVDVSRDFWRIL